MESNGASIAVSGPSGFVGQALVPILAASGAPLRLLPRAPLAELPPGASQVAIGALGEAGEIDPAALAGCHTLIHLAARAHRMGDDPRDLAPYRQVNLAGSVALMRAAIAAGVGRVVYVSSIKVCGEATDNSGAFAPHSVPAPEDAYGISKYEAEQTLSQMAEEAEIELIILRPPLIYGPGAKGNLATLCQAIAAGKRLPLGGIRHNRRSLLGVANLCAAIARIVAEPLDSPLRVSVPLRENHSGKAPAGAQGRGGKNEAGEGDEGQDAELELGAPGGRREPQIQVTTERTESTEEEEGREIQALSVMRPLCSPSVSSVSSVVEKEMVLAGRHWRGASGVRVYHLCDDGVISTRRLVEVLAQGMCRPARLLSLPRVLALTAGTLLGKGAQVRRLYGNLEVDGSAFCRDYSWRPPISLEDGLREMGRAWRDGE